MYVRVSFLVRFLSECNTVSAVFDWICALQVFIIIIIIMGDVDKRNLQYTGRPKRYKTRENEYISALDDAKIHEIDMLLDGELLSPDTTSLDNINRIVVKINDVMKSIGFKHGSV